MDLWAVLADVTTTTITTTTRGATTTGVQTSTTLGSGPNDGQEPWALWATLIVTIIAAIISPFVSYRLGRRTERRKAEDQRLAMLAKEREAAQEARRARVTIEYTPPAPGSNRFGSLDLINHGPSLARDLTWRVEEKPGGPIVETEAQIHGDPHVIKELPADVRLPVGWAVRPAGRSPALSMVLTWKDAEGFKQTRVTVIVPP
jgi:type II secretory pathway pseudopilin PulG